LTEAETNEILNLGQAAKYIGVSVPTMRKYALSGQVPVHIIPHESTKTYRFNRAALARWLNKALEQKAE